MTDREPVQSYEKAIFRLVQWHFTDAVGEDQLEYAIKMVADIWWLSDAKVKHDMKKEINLLVGSAPSRVYRHRGAY